MLESKSSQTIGYVCMWQEYVLRGAGCIIESREDHVS